MISGGAQAEICGDLIHSVWYNSIFQKSDSVTDKYTRPNGYFFDDFNDALEKLWYDDDYQKKNDEIYDNRHKVQSDIKKLENPPDKYKEAYGKALNMYDRYIELTNIVLEPTGNLENFTNEFANAENALISAYDKLELYLPTESKLDVGENESDV